MPREADSLLVSADVLASDTANGEVRCKLGDAIAGRGYSADVPMYCSHGFVGVPDAPDTDGSACQAYYAQDGNEQKIVGTRDNRLTDKVGELEEGDRAIVNKGEARLLLKKKLDLAALLTTSKKTGNTMLIVVDGSAGEIQLVNGDTVIKQTEKEILFMVSGGGTLRVSADGVQIVGPSFQATTGAVQLGDMGGGIAPPPTPATACGIGPSPITVPSTKVFIAP
jgi:hypothetical protein